MRIAFESHSLYKGSMNTISSETDFHDADESQWVRIERYVRGQLFEQGGKNKANIHLTLESTGQDLVIETTQDYLHRLTHLPAAQNRGTM